MSPEFPNFPPNFPEFVYPMASDTVYANTDGSGAETTSYAYTWYPGTLQQQTVTTTLPVVSTADNGSGVAATAADWYDAQGNLVWSQDADGYLTYNEYDPVTGNLLETIQNVNSSTTLPTGVSLDGTGLSFPAEPNGPSATTDYSYDNQERLDQTLGPVHTAVVDGVATSVRTASWTYYDDADNAAVSAQGYVTQDPSGNWTVFTLVNPVSVTITNPDGQVTNQIQATVDVTDGSVGWVVNCADTEVSLGSLSPLTLLANTASGGIGLPPQSAYTAWTTYEYSHKQLVSARVYYAIPGGYEETDYGYNAVGNLEWTKSPAGTITWNVLDAEDETMSTWVGTDDVDATPTDPTGGTAGQAAGNNMVEVSSNLYDADGDVTQTTQYVDSNPADNRTTAYGYDWRDRLLSTMTFDGTYYTYTFNTYDNLGEVLQTQDYQAASPWTVNPAADTLLSQSSTSYDSLGEVYQSTDFLVTSGVAGTAETTEYWYDADGNQVKLTDPDGNTTTWQYDGLGQMTSETNAAQTNAIGENDQYRFDAAGEVTEKIDADGRAIVYSYDGIGRESAENWYASVDSSGNPQGDPTETIAYTYNPAGLLFTASDASATYTYAYDAAGEETSETQQIAGLTPQIIFNEQYTAGDRTQLAASIGGTSDFVNNYQYDSVLGQMSQVTQSGVTGGNAVAEKSVTFAYDNLGEFSTITRYADLAQSEQVAQSTYGYDLNGNVKSLVYSNAGSTLPSYSWTYGALGDMTSSTETLGSLVDSANYTSDSTGQLLTATGSSPSESYSYDSNGNRETVTTSGGQVTCITGPNNELLYDGTYTYSYDGEGNQTARWIASSTSPLETQPGPNDTDITIYTWDNRDRLTSVTHYTDYDAYTGTGIYTSATPDMTVTYTYDVFNRWVGETVTTYSEGTPASVQTTDFAYNGNQIVLQFDASSAPGSAGTLTVANLSHRYLSGQAVDQVFADEQVTNPQTQGNVVWTLTDNQGTVRDLAVYNAQTGVTTVANHRVYDSFGNLVSQTNAVVDCIFGFTGLPFDTASGTYRTPTRLYDPATGRWLCEDWIGFNGRDTNLYRYCGNSPTNATDPSGMQAPVPPEPEHGALWTIWNTIVTWFAPPPVAALEAAPGVANAMTAKAMEARVSRAEQTYGVSSLEAKYALAEYEAYQNGTLRQYSLANPPPPPRPNLPPYVPAYQGH